MRVRSRFSMSSTLSFATETAMSCAPRPVICSTADTRPTAKSPWPATIARATTSFAGLGSLLIVLLKIPIHFFRCAHLLLEPFIELLGGIDAAVFQQVVHRDDLGDDRDVFAGIQRNANLGQRDVEN